MRVATFNVFWFGTEKPDIITRDDNDHARIRDVVHRLDADVIVFQEIIDAQALWREVLRLVPGRDYRTLDGAGQLVASATDGAMKVVVAYDAAKLALVEHARVAVPPSLGASYKIRPAVAAVVQPVAGGEALTVVGVHLASGGVPTLYEHSAQRRLQAESLASWLTHAGADDLRDGPPSARVFVVGDFNALTGNPTLAPLTAGPLAAWGWCDPALQPASAQPTLCDRTKHGKINGIP